MNTAPKGLKHIDLSKKRTSNMWQALLCPDVKILDPDGWDRRAQYWIYSFYEEEISMEEFAQRLMRSMTNNLSEHAWFLPQFPDNNWSEDDFIDDSGDNLKGG